MVQTAYHILVSSSKEQLDADRGDLWDSGEIKSDQTLFVPYDGEALASRQECYWKVGKIRFDPFATYDEHANKGRMQIDSISVYALPAKPSASDGASYDVDASRLTKPAVAGSPNILFKLAESDPQNLHGQVPELERYDLVSNPAM